MKTEQIIKTSNYFLNVRKIDDLAAILGESPTGLKSVALNPEYKMFNIPKKSGGNRRIEAPCDYLKRIQTRLNRKLQCVYYMIKPEFVHGFCIKGYSGSALSGIAANADMHVSKMKIMTLDIKDYFHSFTAKDVWDLFRSDPFDFPEALANILTMLTTWYDILPTGAPTSPVLSNFLTKDLDYKLSVFTASQKGVYSRYADDLTFSFDNYISDSFISHIKDIIIEEGFVINDRKFRILSSGERQTVTGLVVNEKVNISRRYIRQLRAVLFDWKINGIECTLRRYFGSDKNPNDAIKAKFRNSVRGRIQFVGNIRGKNDRIYQRLENQFSSFPD